MKLNLGCGFDRREGWLNVDNFALCEPDRLLDIEATPWDLPTDGFEHVLLKHVLEHVGATFPVFSAVMRELYRVTAPGGIVEIHVPHVRHDSFWTDPTHVRAFTLETFQMLSKRANRAWAEARANVSLIALMIDVDFELEHAEQTYEAEWSRKLRSGEVSPAELYEISRSRWNVARELQVRLRAVK
jgi:SAM-dependent methyltransferase